MFEKRNEKKEKQTQKFDQDTIKYEYLGKPSIVQRTVDPMIAQIVDIIQSKVAILHRSRTGP